MAFHKAQNIFTRESVPWTSEHIRPPNLPGDFAESELIAISQKPPNNPPMDEKENDASNNSDDVVTLGDRVSDLVETWGVTEWWADILATSALFLCLLGIGAILFFIIRPLILRVVKRTTEKTAFDWDDEIRGHGVFRWASHFGPGLFIYFACSQVLSETPVFADLVRAVAELYLILAGVMVVNGLLSFGHVLYRESEFAKKYPIGAFIQVLRLVAVLFAIILVCSSLFNQSPFVLLGGLGVFASVLILVFKDVLLGLAAGIQIVANRMISVGDWLEMPSRKADGDVLHIGLTTVKVQNFDKTITTVPTYSLITESFKNWRGMSESGGRRIKRSIVVELDSIRFLDQQLLDRLSKIEILKDYLSSKEEEIGKWNQDLGLDLKNSPLVNGRRQTNVGAFRAYMLEYIRNHDRIHQDGMTLLVRQLAPNERGLPIEIYCFTKSTKWGEYEDIQADIFDHLFAAAPEFDIHIFKEPSGRDVRLSYNPNPEPAKKTPRKRAASKKKSATKKIPNE